MECWGEKKYGYNPSRIHIEAIVTFDLVDAVEIMLALGTIHLFIGRAERPGKVEQSEPQQNGHSVNELADKSYSLLEPKFLTLSAYKLVQTMYDPREKKIDRNPGAGLVQLDPPHLEDAISRVD